MAYGLSPRLFVENGPANSAAIALASSSSRVWQSFGLEDRLALIEKALKAPANDDCDGLPIAL